MHFDLKKMMNVKYLTEFILTTLIFIIIIIIIILLF